MALYYFKQEVMDEQNIKQTKFSPTLQLRNNIFSSQPSVRQNCGKQTNMMFGGIDLGDIMKRTVMEEMNLIRMENQQNLQRMGGC